MMKREEIIYSRLWGANLYSGVIERKTGYNLTLFFIVNKPCDSEYIKKQALQFLIDEHTDYRFYGKYSEEWVKIFEVEAELLGLQYYPPFQRFGSLDEFVCELKFESKLRPIVPFEIYIIYDDNNLYQRVREILKYEKE